LFLLEGVITEEQAEVSQAISRFRQAAEQEDAMNYNKP
jgi:hypothetical protein